MSCTSTTTVRTTHRGAGSGWSEHSSRRVLPASGPWLRLCRHRRLRYVSFGQSALDQSELGMPRPVGGVADAIGELLASPHQVVEMFVRRELASGGGCA